ncbi:UDP-N-acetylglucosamine 4,6-dehydratase (inverting) [Aestuariispira ectoiniformans]|uniref:UDP-N-acetylglucosamine 4,6-dehydratase (inverting) n=1 Tax=Aestuariispira ectoiniformans TaxID=2775080 RepID=UPI00223A9857|nr:UDP-N-acetylglucosamine 4,6-dehydratase (inverting) [Aestuariispira ectoiniformans]
MTKPNYIRDFSDLPVDLNGKSILVTGGTGSFGRRFVKTVLERYKVNRLVVFSRDEQKQFDMAHELPVTEYPELRYFIGDVRDAARLELAMSGIDYVIHAAAMKHVSIAEYNPFECINTNVHGAENIVRAAIRQGVKRVIALSTDKACSPINLYGTSKLASDKIFVAGNHLAGSNGPRFSVVRYGNVVGSNGSVVPFFKKLLERGTDHLPITHPDMTRFWITLEQGVDFVLSCLELMQAGEIFVPKIPSMRVVDLAKSMAPDLEHRTIGIRPGEKLHEAMITVDDARQTAELDDRYVILPEIRLDIVTEYWNSTRRVASSFQYTSDSNPEWLDTAAIKHLLENY